MAEVYRAVSQGPGGFQRQFVLKRIRAEKTDSDDFVNMFINEARISALLEHPNIVQVYDFGEVAGDYFLAMEYLRGKDLLTVMRHVRAADRDLPIGVAAFAAMETARGLAYAHGLSQGGVSLDIVHRDVTPSNIMLLKTGGVKLLDFGIARAAMKLRTTTPTGGLIKGKFAYLSPEQIRGKGIDGRSDIFSLGVVLWECLTGQRLFWDPNDLQTMRNILEKPVPPPSLERPGLPSVLDDVVLRALDRDPNRRFANASQMAEALSGYLSATRFTHDHVARLLEETFGSTSFNDDPLPEYGTPIPAPPPTPRTLIAQARAAKTAAEIAEEEAGYSVVSSVRPLTDLALTPAWRKGVFVAAAALVLASGTALGWRALDRAPHAEPGAPTPSVAATAVAPEPSAQHPAPLNALAVPSPAEANVAPAAENPVVGPPVAVAASKPAFKGQQRALRAAPIAPTVRHAEAPAVAVDMAAAKDARARGLEALGGGQMQKARMALEAALVGLPHDGEVLGGLAESAFELGDLNTARSFAKRATAAAPRVLKHQLLLGDVSLKMNKLKDAVEAYRAASALSPADASVRARLARAETTLSAEP